MTRIDVASSDLTDIRVMVVAVVLLVKGDLVAPELVPEFALGAAYAGSPAFRLLVFVAMMFGGTLGGNATLIGASANVVGAGICAAQGRPVTFGTFARYGVPLTVCQLTLSAFYVVVLSLIVSPQHDGCASFHRRSLGTNSAKGAVLAAK